MCFKNLPIEFDEQGRAHLKEGAPDPFAYQANGHVEERAKRMEQLLVRNGHVKEVSIDPVTRVAGALAFHTVVDLVERKVHEAHSQATLFRGYEVILKGRDPRDAIFISSRACGVCGGVHANTSAEAIEMAFGVQPPPMGIIVRNLGQAGEFLYDHPLHLFLLAGPDYSEAVVKATNPDVWTKAEQWSCPHAEVHGFAKMSDLMTALNPLSGSLYLEALEVTRRAREMIVLVWGKYPHPQTIVPGGISTTVSLQTFNEYQTRLFQLLDHSKRMALIWDDISNFLYHANPAYEQVGARPLSQIDLGIWDRPEVYDATYANADKWGEGRWATPGVMIEGELKSTNLQHINMGLEEFIEHSYYEPWANGNVTFRSDPLGNPISPHHPWNKQTLPAPQGRSWKEKYTWATSPRWDRQVVEGGAYSRLWLTTVAKKLPANPFMETDGSTMRMTLPKGALREVTLEWHVPKVLNAIERNRARAFAQAYTALVCLNNLLTGYNLMKKGETAVSRDFKVPRDQRIGVGFWGAGRGYLAHHLTMDGGVLTNYQICTPSTINASPIDPLGQPGPYEEAVMNTPLMEQFSGEEDFKGIDILRAIRSFDPCMPCTTHVYAGAHTVVQEVTTCGCELDD